MNLFHFLRRYVLTALVGTFLLALGACQTTQVRQEFPAPGANWRTSVGQLQYVTPQRSVVGEAVVSSQGTQDFQLDYTAGPGVPLMRLRETGNSAGAEGLFARGNWQGDPARAPQPVGSWMALREAFVAVNGAGAGKRSITAHSPAGTGNPWIASASAGGQRRVSVQFPHTGERFVFVFTQPQGQEQKR